MRPSEFKEGVLYILLTNLDILQKLVNDVVLSNADPKPFCN